MVSGGSSPSPPALLDGDHTIFITNKAIMIIVRTDTKANTIIILDEVAIGNSAPRTGAAAPPTAAPKGVAVLAIMYVRFLVYVQ